MISAIARCSCAHALHCVTMYVICVVPILFLSLIERAGGYTIPSCKPGGSCLQVAAVYRNSGASRRIARTHTRCKGEQHRHRPFVPLLSSQQYQQVDRRRHGLAGSERPTATATGCPTPSMSMHPGASSEGCKGLDRGQSPSPQQQQRQHQREVRGKQSRADFLRTGASVAGLAAVLLSNQQAAQAIDLGGVEFGFGDKDKFNIPPEDNPEGLRSPRPLAYRVEYTDPPTTVPFPRNIEPNLVKEISGQRLVFFGVHGEDVADQVLTAEVIGKISANLENKAAIGLEQVEMQFQPALDAYIAEGQGQVRGEEADGDLDSADAELAKATQWRERCVFPFESFLPLFHLARSRGLPMVAMGVDSEKVFEVMQNGMDSLGEDERNEYVSDFKGFVTYVRDKGFQVYADRLIFPTYDRLKDAGLLGDKPPTKPNFFAARILADEALASKAVDWATNNKGMKLFVVQREEHVKFGFGASGRAARIAQNLGSEMSTKSMLINPTAEDSLSLNRSLRLALEYADDLQNGKPLANYLWFSKSPRVNQIPRMVNPEDKGWLEKLTFTTTRGGGVVVSGGGSSLEREKRARQR